MDLVEGGEARGVGREICAGDNVLEAIRCLCDMPGSGGVCESE